MRQVQNGTAQGVEALMAEITTRAWQDGKFLSDLKADREAVVARVAAEMGIDASGLSDLDFEIEPNPVGDAPFERPEPQEAGGGATINQWTCGYCVSVTDCNELTNWDCHTYTWWDSCATNLCPSVFFTCGRPDDPMCNPV